MKELVKPIKQEDVGEAEAYCDNGTCQPQSGTCTNNGGCGIHTWFDDDEKDQILF